MAACVGRKSKMAVVFLLVILFQACVEAARAEHQLAVGLKTDGMYRKLLQTIDCKAACDVRCQEASLNERCIRACSTCCARCHCVPPGTTGNKDVCPCYANMKTHGDRPKCP